MRLLYIDGYVLADRRTDSHFFVDGFIGWSCSIHCLNGCVSLPIRFVDWLELATLVYMLCHDEKLVLFEGLCDFSHILVMWAKICEKFQVARI